MGGWVGGGGWGWGGGRCEGKTREDLRVWSWWGSEAAAAAPQPANRDASAAAALFPARSCMVLRRIGNKEPWLAGRPPICCTMRLWAGLLQWQTAHSLRRLPPHHAPRAAFVVAPCNPTGGGGPAGWNCWKCGWCAVSKHATPHARGAQTRSTLHKQSTVAAAQCTQWTQA